MKKVLSIIGILLATAGFLYSGIQIFGTTGKFMEHNGLQSNIKKLTEEKNKKAEQLAELTKKNTDMKAQYEKLKADKKIKTVYLTFDDGPSAHTDQILEILKKNNIKATFFVIGIGKNYNDYKKIIDHGHVLGLHTYSHEYKEVYANEESFFKDLYKIRDAVKSTTGLDVKITRFPGGSSNAKASKALKTAIINRMTKEGYVYFDWNCDSTDASGNNVPVEKLVKYGVCTTHPDINVLMHDTNAKKTTVQALQQIIDGYRKAGYTFETLDVNSPKIQHMKQPELK
jgi:polysaccharide deacetylase